MPILWFFEEKKLKPTVIYQDWFFDVILMILDPNPHVKSPEPKFKFLTNRIALFHFQIEPELSCKLGLIGIGSWF